MLETRTIKNKQNFREVEYNRSGFNGKNFVICSCQYDNLNGSQCKYPTFY